MMDNSNTTISDKELKLVIDENNHKLFFRQDGARRCLTLQSVSEFIMQIICGGEALTVSDRNCTANRFLEDNSILTIYEHDLFQIRLRYRITDDIFQKTLRFQAKQPLEIHYAKTEVSQCDAALTKGGEGQPIFVNNMAFMGIAFPVAQNSFHNSRIVLGQAPFIKLDQEESYDFYPVVYGIGCHPRIETDFVNYIRKNRIKTPPGQRIYGDWAAHDELSDNKPLYEKMAMRIVDGLNRAKQEYGVCFDTYVMDAFWYEEKRPYTDFKKETWPNGIQPFLSYLQKNGLDFGLWFDVNMEQLKMNGYTRREEDNDKLCLADEKNAKLLFDGIEAQLEACQLSSIKLDFAYFDCYNRDHTNHAHSHTDSKEPAVRHFLEGLERLRRIRPDLIVLAYNGFTTDLKYLARVEQKRCDHVLSPWWLFYLNYIYCGDPRPSEVPTSRLSDSLLYYTDAMIEQFVNSLIPIEAIDDHGTMIGKTGTIYYLEAEGFSDTWMMNISRGGKKLHLYGEPDYLTGEHWQLIHDSYAMFDFVCREDTVTQAILNPPHTEQPYGYSNSNGQEGYLTMVNCCAASQVVSVALEEWAYAGNMKIQLVYQNGQYAARDSVLFSSAFSTVLPPESVVVYQWQMAPEKLAAEGFLKLEINAKDTLFLPEGTKHVAVNWLNIDGTPLRTGQGIPDGLQITVEGTVIKNSERSSLWSGVSWVNLDLPKTGSGNIAVSLENNSPVDVIVRWRTDEEGE